MSSPALQVAAAVAAAAAAAASDGNQVRRQQLLLLSQERTRRQAGFNTEVEYLLQSRLAAATASDCGSVASSAGSRDTAGYDTYVGYKRKRRGSDGVSAAAAAAHLSPAEEAKRKKNANEDPNSHRIIEKRRRDRMNNCLKNLSELIPSTYLKKGRGRLEKTEIIEMSIKYIQHLQKHARTTDEGSLDSEVKSEDADADAAAKDPHSSQPGAAELQRNVEAFRLGYHEALSEAMHFLAEKEKAPAAEHLCTRFMTHMQKYYEKLSKVRSFRQPRSYSAGHIMSPTSASSSVTGGSSSNSSASTVSSATSSGYNTATTTGSTRHHHHHHHLPARQARRELEDAPQTHHHRRMSHPHQFTGSQFSPPGSLRSSADAAAEDLCEDADDQPENLSTHSPRITDQEQQLHPAEAQHEQYHDHPGKYKFKANLRERFSHEPAMEERRPIPLASSECPANKRKRVASYSEGIGISGAAIAAAGFYDQQARELASEELDRLSQTQLLLRHQQQQLQRARLPAEEAQQQGNSNSPLRLLSYAASTVDTRMAEEQRQQAALLQPKKEEEPEAPKARKQPPARPRVAIFALHPKGAYYVPAKVDYAVLERQRPASCLSGDGGPIVLHPVTIHVAFDDNSMGNFGSGSSEGVPGPSGLLPPSRTFVHAPTQEQEELAQLHRQAPSRADFVRDRLDELMQHDDSQRQQQQQQQQQQHPRLPPRP